jgi:hypothetical protein
MTQFIRRTTLLALVTIGAGLVLGPRPVQAQGAPNTYEDFPFNQGSLAYRPLKPKPRVRSVPRQVYTAPVRGGYTYVQPGTGGLNQGTSWYGARSYGYTAPRYYYPTAPVVVQPYQAAPVAPSAPR